MLNVNINNQINNDYRKMIGKHIPMHTIFFKLYRKYGSTLTTKQFSLEFQVKEHGLRWDWDVIYNINNVYHYLKKRILDKYDIEIILSKSPDFKLSWINDEYMDLEWGYCIYLSETFVRLNLPLSYIEDNINKDWCYNILSHHPSLNKEFVYKFPIKDWCHITLDERFQFEKDKNIKINMIDNYIIIDVPSIFPLWYLYWNNYIEKSYCIYLPNEYDSLDSDTLFSEIGNEIIII